MIDAEPILRDLIALPSVNPAFVPPGDPHAGEERVASFLADLATKAGLSIERQPVAPGRANLLIRLDSRSRKPLHRLLLAPHMDTVGGENLPGDHFKPRRHQGRLYGRGACDTKGSIAAMISALVDLARSGGRPDRTEIVMAALVDEENAQAGSRALARTRMKCDLAIVGEPTQLRVVTAHKGDLWLRLETLGRAAHGARPELGRNAVHEMARIVDLLETRYAAMLAKRRHPLLGRATINVGAIRGGHQPNIVPDRCIIQIDRRTLPGEKDGAVKRELMAYLRRHGFRPRLMDTKGVPSQALETDPGRPLVRALMDHVRQKQAVGVDYFSDAGVLGAAGMPCVLFGPGNIAQAHTANEWIQLRQLERATRLLRGFMGGLP